MYHNVKRKWQYSMWRKYGSGRRNISIVAITRKRESAMKQSRINMYIIMEQLRHLLFSNVARNILEQYVSSSSQRREEVSVCNEKLKGINM
jgi:hypothetical protein